MEALSCSGTDAVSATLAAALQFFTVSQCLVTEPWPQQAQLQNGSQFDFIVVGGGTAGSVLAARLTEVEGVSVLLVEAGEDPPQESIIPGFRDAMKGSQYDWNFTTVNDDFSSQALKQGSQSQPRGKMLGGSGSINDMIYSRGFPADYTEWAATLGDHWDWPSVLAYFKKTEYLTDERIINDPELMLYHSRNGEMEVTGLNLSTPTTDRFLDAFKEMGFDIVRDMTNPLKFGVGRFSHTIRNGQRESSATALLNKSKGRLFVLKGAFATKLLIDDEKKAYGVNVILNDKLLVFYTKKEVILSAGTFNTPKLLMLSGIGPKEHLENLGIPVVQDLPVGDNLHDHIMVLSYMFARSGTCSSEKNENYMEMITYLYDRTGSLSKTNTMGAYLSAKGSTDKTVPDFALYPTCVPKGSSFYEGCSNIIGFKDEICAKLAKLNAHHELLNIAVVLLKPKSRGTVRLNSTNPMDDPLIRSGTFSATEDLEGFPEAINVAYGIGETTYFREKQTSRVEFDLDECKGLSENEALKCQARSMATSAWHAVGTAAMGAVVDAELRVKGVLGLRVADASVMPKVTRGNTFAPVVMIAEKAADFIKQDMGIEPQVFIV